MTVRIVRLPQPALVVVMIAGAVLWVACSPAVQVSTTSPGPTPSPPSSAEPRPIGVLSGGQTYHETEFGEPLRFTVPDAFGSSATTGDFWDTHGFRIRIAGSGAITFHDDARLVNDICHATGVMDDLPGTLDAVAAWLTSSEGLTVSPARDITTKDGATARSWDIELGEACSVTGWPHEAAVSFKSGERHRIYAVPTADDLILIFTWGTGYGGEGEEGLDALNLATDDLVRSIQFD